MDFLGCLQAALPFFRFLFLNLASDQKSYRGLSKSRPRVRIFIGLLSVLGAMDSFARGLKNAAKLIEDGTLDSLVKVG